jgi:sulfite exporter TauE/SafE
MTFGLPPSVRSSLSALLPFQLAYNLGRISSYVVAGGLMGGLGLLVAQLLPIYYAQRAMLLLAALFMVALGLYLGGWWSGLARIEKLGGALWRRLEPAAKRVLPVRTLPQAWLLGVLWGWLPCGLVYSMLVWTITAGSVLQGAGLMFAFALGTLPNLLAMGLLAGAIARSLGNIWVRRGAGVVVLAFGVWTLWTLW